MFFSISYDKGVKKLGCWPVVYLQIAEILIVLINNNQDNFLLMTKSILTIMLFRYVTRIQNELAGVYVKFKKVM
jgi:hypothetical protein